LLDEPTNHLDMRAKDVLLKALMDYTGTVVFVSHDRYFIDKLATRVFEVGDGKVEVYPGNYEDYRWRKEGGAEKLQETISRSTIIAQPVNGNKSEVIADDGKSKRLNPIKRKQMEERVKELEAEVSRAETAIAECEAALQTFVSAEETARTTQELASHRVELQSRLAEWEELAQSLEA
jgi:ATP-binding cassette subfamily F protein 3